ncbi:hypothetical protein BJY00DRAFT_278324 [Aspergillus carlsbadensis]|nr:hypothetical protein BJY00DRAFT_278324 [Aspergillus carlsbadensis]
MTWCLSFARRRVRRRWSGNPGPVFLLFTYPCDCSSSVLDSGVRFSIRVRTSEGKMIGASVQSSLAETFSSQT